MALAGGVSVEGAVVEGTEVDGGGFVVAILVVDGWLIIADVDVVFVFVDAELPLALVSQVMLLSRISSSYLL